MSTQEETNEDKINEEEQIKLFLEEIKVEFIQKSNDLFYIMDLDGSKTISMDEYEKFSNLTKKALNDVTKKQFDNFKEIDENNDGEISFEEYNNNLQKILSSFTSFDNFDQKESQKACIFGMNLINNIDNLITISKNYNLKSLKTNIQN
jgi:hypothetical protein